MKPPPASRLFPLVDKLAENQYATLFSNRSLSGAWESLESGKCDIVISPDMHFRTSSEINFRPLYNTTSVYVASPDHPIHNEPEPLAEETRLKYRDCDCRYRKRASCIDSIAVR